MSHVELVENLASVISKYLEGHKDRNLKDLSKRIDISYTTLRRILVGSTVPNFENVLAILSFTCTQKETMDFLKKHYSFGEWFEQLVAVNRSDSPFGQTSKPYIKDKESFVIVSLSSHVTGVTREKIRDLLGIMGERKLRLLVDHGILIESNHRFYLSSKSAYPEPSFTLDKVECLVDHLSERPPPSSLRHVSVQSGGVSVEARGKIAKILRDTEARILAITELHPGNISLHACLIKRSGGRQIGD